MTFFERHVSSSQLFRSQTIPSCLRSIRKRVASGTPDSGVVYRSRDERWFAKHHFFPQACALDHHILCILRGRHFYSDPNFPGVKSGCSNWPHLRELSKAERMEELSRHRLGFKGLREVYDQTRAFQLVPFTGVRGRVGEHPVRILEGAVAEEKARVGFDGFSSDPLVVYDPQRARPDHREPLFRREDLLGSPIAGCGPDTRNSISQVEYSEDVHYSLTKFVILTTQHLNW